MKKHFIQFLKTQRSPLLSVTRPNVFSFSTLRDARDFQYWRKQVPGEHYELPRVQEITGLPREDQRSFKNQEAKREEMDEIPYREDPLETEVQAETRKDKEKLRVLKSKPEMPKVGAPNKDKKKFESENSEVMQKEQYEESNTYSSPRSNMTQQKESNQEKEKEEVSHKKKEELAKGAFERNEKLNEQREKYNPKGQDHEEGSESAHQKGATQSHHPFNDQKQQGESKNRNSKDE